MQILRIFRRGKYFRVLSRYQKFSNNKKSFDDFQELKSFLLSMKEWDKKKFKEEFSQFKDYLKKQYFYQTFFICAILYLLTKLHSQNLKNENRKISVNEFQEILEENSIKLIQIQESKQSSMNNFYQCTIIEQDGSEKQMNIPNIQEFIKLIDSKKIPYVKLNTNPDLYEYYMTKVRAAIDMLSPIIQITFGLVIAFSLYNMLKKQSSQNVVNKIQPLNIKQKFSDIAGIEEAKKEVMEFVNFLQNPQKFKEIGAKIPKGGLLTGPPGTGKTLLAKACAGEASVPFYYMSGSEFITGYVGQGAKRIQNLFKEAQKNSPSIIFIDELDAIGAKRSNQMGNSEGYNTLNQLLVEMDGFGTDSNVVVFGATNLGSSLDDALVRAGRFDRKIELTLPEKKARAKILDIHMKKIKLRKKDYQKIQESMANLTPGFCGADLENLCNEAAIFAVRKQRSFVEKEDFEMALERIVSGIETHNKLSSWQKKKIAYYEASKAVVSWFLKHCDPVMKMSLLSRVKKEKGYSQYFKRDQNLQVEQELIEKIAFLLAGKICEQILFKDITSISQQDLTRAQDLAQKMVTKLGMSENLGYLSLKDDDYKQYSEKTNIQIDKEITKIIKKASQIARKIIEDRKNLLEELASQLLEKEKLEHLEIIKILGERPFEHSKAYEEYLKEQKK